MLSISPVFAGSLGFWLGVLNMLKIYDLNISITYDNIGSVLIKVLICKFVIAIVTKAYNPNDY